MVSVVYALTEKAPASAYVSMLQTVLAKFGKSPWTVLFLTSSISGSAKLSSEPEVTL